MGYDTLSANDIGSGTPQEDTHLLRMAKEQNRYLLTRDRDLAGRDDLFVIYLASERIDTQIRQLAGMDLINPQIRMIRCSLCNSLLTKVPGGTDSHTWCPVCRKEYWEGSHTRQVRIRLADILQHD